MSAITDRARARPRARETDLIIRAQAGEAAAFEELASGNADRLYAIALRRVGDPGEAEEVVQETLLRAWKGISEFRGRSAFLTWLHRIVVNEANRALERRTRRPQTVQLTAEQLPANAVQDHGPTWQVESQELFDALERALLSLPLPYRTAIVLRDIEGLSTSEAANAAGVGQAAFNSRLHKARLKLRAAIGGDALVGLPG